MKFILPLLIFFSTASFAQQADFLVLKKKNKGIGTYFAGGNIEFTAESGAHISALINAIKNDTIYLQEFVVRMLPTVFGTYILDTAGSYHYKYHYNQIKAIGKQERKNFNLSGSGAALLGGGTVLTLASGVVYLADREKFSAPLLFASMGLGVVGYFLCKDRTHGMTIGKKYKLEYMDMSNRVNR